MTCVAILPRLPGRQDNDTTTHGQMGHNMQKALLQTAGLACRLWLALYFGAHVAAHLNPETRLWVLSHDTFSGSAALDAGTTLLLGLIALWLVLGIYSRIVAMTGLVISTAEAALYGDAVLTPAWVAAALAVAILALTGGGRLRLHAGGWRLRDAL